MSRTVAISFNPQNISYNIYTGLTNTTATGLTCNNVTSGCEFEFDDDFPYDYIWVKLISNICSEQIYQVYIGSRPPLNCVLSGMTYIL